MQSDPSELISTRRDLEGLLESVGEVDVCAIDTEADSLHRYRESLCLIQFAWSDQSVLIDPLALEVEDLDPLRVYLGKSTVWMHGADYDMTMLRRVFGELPPKVYDTQIGARLLGLRKFGLANLVEHYFGVKLSKTSQKADWGKRPLSEKMASYALNDVRYLLSMGDQIVAELREIGRLGWFEESCDSARTKVLERDESREEPWRVQGAGRLDRKGLHFLKVLWEWRDLEAERWDRPSFMVVTNRQMLEWSQLLAKGQKPEFPGHYRPNRRRRLEQALAEARDTPAEDYPERVKGLRRRRDKDFDERVARMIKERNTVAGRLDIEPSLIASRAVIESLAADEPEAQAQLMHWQRECLGML